MSYVPALSDAPIIASQATLTGRWRGIFGESAVWSPKDGGTWWVDMHGLSIILTMASGPTRFWKTPNPELPYARGLVLREAGGVLVALTDRLARFDAVSGEFSYLPLDLKLPQGHVFNDATVDMAGRLIIGTMLPGRGNDAKACFYQIDEDLKVKTLITGINTTNGLAFSPDGKTLYFSDSTQAVRKIWSASYDSQSGDMGEPELFIDFSGLPGRPDGACIDTDGGYWIVGMGSKYLHRFTPDGKLERSLELPIDTPTRPTFGGDGLKTIFLTTGGLKGGEFDDGLKGGLLTIPSEFTGLKPWKTKL
jgi:L-arabinonolactonase